MRHAVDARFLVTRSGAYVRRQHSRVQVRELDRDDAKAVPQDGLVDGVVHGGAQDSGRSTSAQSPPWPAVAREPSRRARRAAAA